MTSKITDAIGYDGTSAFWRCPIWFFFLQGNDKYIERHLDKPGTVTQQQLLMLLQVDTDIAAQSPTLEKKDEGADFHNTTLILLLPQFSESFFTSLHAS